MTVKTDTSWVSYYESFADALLTYQNKRTELTKKLTELAKDPEVGIYIEYLFKDDGGQLDDICPFTFMGIFNRGIKKENRIALAEKLAQCIGLYRETPNSFDGIPLLNNQNSWFYTWKKVRAPATIDIHWKLFDSALRYAMNSNEDNRSLFIKIFNQASAHMSKIGKLTIGLFWLRPNFYITLDNKTRKYLRSEYADLSMIDTLDEKLDGKQYLEINDEMQKRIATSGNSEHSLVEISHRAWKSTDEDEDDEGDDSATDNNFVWMYRFDSPSSLDFETRAKQSIESGTIYLTWKQFQQKNLLSLDKNELEQAIAEATGSENKGLLSRVNQVWDFLHNINIDDLCISLYNKDKNILSS